ncbi:MAG: hypothetical protein LBR12_02990, partial [Opitutaceae bacterium]|nr:hypothetical protein [Opitutaceae bacterium]
MKRHPFLLIATGALAAGLLLSAGCSDGKPRRLSENETLEIKNLEADARFAASLRDFARAEKDHAAAAAINPDDPSLQLLLGMAQARQGKKDDARKAYKKAVKLAEA